MDYGVTKSPGITVPDIVIDTNGMFVLLGLLGLLFIVSLIFLSLIRKKYAKGKYLDHSVFMIRLPKDKPGDQNSQDSVQQMQEDIAVGETIFGSIGSLKAKKGFTNWLFGREDHFSFEIVASSKKIFFYIVAPKEHGRYIEQQIHAHYPDALIEKVDDYNVFTPDSNIFSSYLKTQKGFVYPIKTYTKMESDPMNSILNVMSKLEEDESMILQVLVRSAKGSWHRKISEVVRKVNSGKSLKEALAGSGTNKTLAFVSSVANEASLRPKKQDQQVPDNQPQKLSSMEEEMLKNIEEKNSKAGLDVNLRIIVSTKNSGNGNVYLNNIASAFNTYNYFEYGNNFRHRILKKNTKIINDFIYRRFDEKLSFLLNTEELTSIYHFPSKNTEIPNIAWLTARQAPAPTNIPTEGILLGHNEYRGVRKEIRVKRNDRRRHSYIIGKSGGGKSVFIADKAIQDILNGEGVCVLDPHGDLVEDILKRIPPERAEDVILFSPADVERPMGLNIIEYDERYPEQKTFVINELIKIFDKLYDLKSSGGPMFEQYMRNALLLIMADPESGSTLMEIPKVMADADFRKMKLEKCKDKTVVDFWQKQAEKAGGEAALANVVPYITSKLTQFVSNDIMRPIIGQQDSAFNVRDIMDKQKILLVDLSKGKIGEMNASLLGLILVGKILMAALSRTDMAEKDRKDFYLYIDEFQNFTTDSIATILSEARKYGLNLIIAHQYLGQLGKEDTSIRDAVFGNVGSWYVLKIGSEDAEVLEKEFAPTFNQFDLINIPAHTCYAKLLIDGTASVPFSMKTLWPIPGIERPELVEKIKTLSRLKYGQDRSIIDAEIIKRTTGIM